MTEPFVLRRPRPVPVPETPTLAIEIATLRDLDMAELRARYEELLGRPARGANREALWRRVAWEMQARVHGGLTDAAKTKLAELDARIDFPVEVEVKLPKKSPPAGTVISREWRNQRIDVVVNDAGMYEWNGVPFRSLSGVAKAVTGTGWNGNVFFGLKERKRK